jgi:hypothetical protein
LNAFRRQSGRANVNYLIELPGIQNPIKVIPTGSFIFRTMTQNGFGIDSFDGANIQMITPAEI